VAVLVDLLFHCLHPGDQLLVGLRHLSQRSAQFIQRSLELLLQILHERDNRIRTGFVRIEDMLPAYARQAAAQGKEGLR
jgi:hypothetical protein